MHKLTIFSAAASLAALAIPATAQATTFPFSGTVTGTGFGAIDPSCAPAPARGTLDTSTSSGSSNLGSFTYGHDWCFYGANGPINGTFNVDFGDNALAGTVVGTAVPSGIVGLTDLNLTYTILDGTGLYSNATGSFGGLATADVRGGNGSVFTLNFTGSFNAVPEPATWIAMLLGFGLIGGAMRRRQQSGVKQLA